ncbi:large ribosomal subunit protein mL39-like [Babylonia areolata]|uniref:large ribosomal subunit protein mL39-like n=1 Tax=Babylonia areolata TaxID=304850 RepID=UPI003FD4AE5D
MAAPCGRFALLRKLSVPKTPSGCYKHTDTQLANSAVREKRSKMFEAEKQRQRSLIPRIEKMEVKFKGQVKDSTLIMNKNLSTPFHCAMHIDELLTTRSALALVDGQPWDMHRPLTHSCQLELLHFHDLDPTIVNEAFWRTCSFILGYVLETAFKDQHYVELCSFPKPNVRSGSFVYDADLKLPEWTPSSRELDILGRTGYKLFFKDLPFERLEVDASLAQKMFEDNRFKWAQVPSMAERSETGSKVTVYRMGDHVDITAGPLIARTGQLGRFAVTAFHNIQSSSYGPLTRVQGVALPVQLNMHYWTFDNILGRRAKKLNKAPVPQLTVSQSQQVRA